METNQETEKQLITKATNRRDALKRLGIGVIGVAGLNALAAPSAFAKKKSDNQKEKEADIAVLQFALNLEYLEAEYYTYATKGHGIEQEGVDISGRQGPPGATTVKMNPQVPFSDMDVQQYANEIAQDERNHVTFLRGAIESLGGKPVAKPAIDLRDSWNAFAMAAGLGSTFDPFANDTNFLLGSFVFEDVGVTAYRGGAALLNRPGIVSAAAGILAVEAYHAGVIREKLYSLHDATVNSNVQKISDARDMLDNATDDDQGIVDDSDQANLVPTDSRGLAYARTVREVLNIVYFAQNARAGGFFPMGINAG